MSDDFTLQGKSAASQLVKFPLIQYKTLGCVSPYIGI